MQMGLTALRNLPRREQQASQRWCIPAHSPRRSMLMICSPVPSRTHETSSRSSDSSTYGSKGRCTSTQVPHCSSNSHTWLHATMQNSSKHTHTSLIELIRRIPLSPLSHSELLPQQMLYSSSTVQFPMLPCLLQASRMAGCSVSAIMVAEASGGVVGDGQERGLARTRERNRAAATAIPAGAGMVDDYNFITIDAFIVLPVVRGGGEADLLPDDRAVLPGVQPGVAQPVAAALRAPPPPVLPRLRPAPPRGRQAQDHPKFRRQEALRQRRQPPPSDHRPLQGLPGQRAQGPARIPAADDADRAAERHSEPSGDPAVQERGVQPGVFPVHERAKEHPAVPAAARGDPQDRHLPQGPVPPHRHPQQGQVRRLLRLPPCTPHPQRPVEGNRQSRRLRVRRGADRPSLREPTSGERGGDGGVLPVAQPRVRPQLPLQVSQ